MKPNPDDFAHWLRLTRAAEVLGSTPMNVLMQIKRGHLIGGEDEDGWLVDPESLAALLRQRDAGELPAVYKSGCSKDHGCQSCG